MTRLLFSSLVRRWSVIGPTHKFGTIIAPVCGTFLVALLVCIHGSAGRANPNVSDISMRPDRIQTAPLANGLNAMKYLVTPDFVGHFAYQSVPSIMDDHADSTSPHDAANDIFKLLLKPSLSQLLFLSSLTPPAGIPLFGEQSDGLTPKTIIGTASMYDPVTNGGKNSGDLKTASGELYDETTWTAAIQIDLRAQFGGVRYGKNYKPTYALVESDTKRVIVKINDVGPLKPGRIIDLNKRTMKYFDPTLELGLLNNIRVTPLLGVHWKIGPVDDYVAPINLAGNFMQ